jgi:putative DNA primase/helicase
MAFDPDLLPGPFRELAEYVASSMCVPIDLPAVSLMVTLAGAVNRRAVIRPKRRDGWTVVCNLWGAIVAPPGYKKSPILDLCTRPLLTLEGEFRVEVAVEMKEYQRSAEVADLRLAAWKEKVKAAAKKNEDIPDRPEVDTDPPTSRRLVVNDATVEKLHDLMAQNPAGLLCLRDELTGWFAQLDKQGREAERSFVLTSWNGNDGFTVDRVGRGEVHADHVCLSLLGGIQPGRLHSYMKETLADGPGNDGLMQRFQMTSYPDLSPDYEYVDREPNKAVLVAVEDRLRMLVGLRAEDPLRLRFDDDAQGLFVEWLTGMERRARRPGEHPAFAGHLSKYNSLMPKLAALIHLGEGETGEEVNRDSTQRAMAWLEYLESHARRIYAAALTPEVVAARALAEKIQSGRAVVDEVLTVRDVYQKRWHSLDSPEAVKAAADVLVDHEWLRPIPGDAGPQGGRPSLRYEVNPKVIG